MAVQKDLFKSQAATAAATVARTATKKVATTTGVTFSSSKKVTR